MRRSPSWCGKCGENNRRKDGERNLRSHDRLAQRKFGLELVSLQSRDIALNVWLLSADENANERLLVLEYEKYECVRRVATLLASDVCVF